MGLKKTILNIPEWRYYFAYGLTLRSEIELPELRELRPARTHSEHQFDATLRLGGVPEHLPDGLKFTYYVEHSGNTALLSIKGITRILLENLCDITIEVLDNSPLSDVRAFVLGSGLGLLLHQRNELPLHVAALEAPEGAIAITGPSGAGKSTSAINLHRLTSWPIICDDVAVANLIDARIELVSGINRIKIWKDVVESLGIDGDTLERDIIRTDKFHLSESSLFAEGGKDLKAIFVLKDAPASEPKELFGAEKFSAVLNSVYRPEFAGIFWDQSELAERCSDIARHVSVFEISRDKSKLEASHTAKLIYDTTRLHFR